MHRSQTSQVPYLHHVQAEVPAQGQGTEDQRPGLAASGQGGGRATMLTGLCSERRASWGLWHERLYKVGGSHIHYVFSTMALPPARAAGWPLALLVHGRCSGPGRAGAVLPPACEPHSAPCTRLPAAAPSDSPVHTGQGSDCIRPWRGSCSGRSTPRPAAGQGESALHSQNPGGPREGRGAALEPGGQRGHHSPGHPGAQTSDRRPFQS